MISRLTNICVAMLSTRVAFRVCPYHRAQCDPLVRSCYGGR